MSAYRGRNAEVGALGTFLEAVKDKVIPQGSYLLVESLDRVSRQTVRKAVRTMEDIVAAGVNLVDLSDGGRRYSIETLDNDQMSFLLMAIRFMRAHEESAVKSRRLLAVYEHKRVKAKHKDTGEPFTRMLPAWLQWQDATRTHAVVPERAAVLNSIFEKADQGWGQHRIAQWLNEQGTPTWGGRGKQRKAEYWHRSYIKKLLTNSAVVGTFTPHQRLTDANGKRKRKPLEPIESYFPAVVERDLFERVASRARARAPRGRNATIEPASIFAGVLRCAHCGGVVTRVSKRPYVYLVCSQANRKGTKVCKYLAVRYDDVEQALRHNARAIIKDAPRGRGTKELEAEIANLDDVVSVIADEARDLADEFVHEKSGVLRQRLREKEVELEKAREDLRALRVRRDTVGGPYVQRRLTALRDALRRKPFSVTEANKALKEAVSKIVLDPEEGRLAIYWHHASEPTDDIWFASRHDKTFSKVR
jgi:DNA invertase Pin-like site-specific DNA recombinase